MKQLMHQDTNQIDERMGLFTLILQIVVSLLGIIVFILFHSCSAASDHLSGVQLDRYTQALGLYSDGRFKEAAQIVRTSSKGHYPTQILCGKALFFTGDYSGAKTALQEALRLRSTSVEARLYMAYIQRASGHIKDAQKIAEDILVDDPENLRALRLLADLAEGQGAKTAYLDRAISGMGEAALLFVERARSRYVSGDCSGSLQDISAALSLLPENSSLRSPIVALQQTIERQFQDGKK
jgi:tetratricopeptide (TPR) repeat protein